MNRPYYQDESVTLYHGAALDVLRDMPDPVAPIQRQPELLDFAGAAHDAATAFTEGTA